MKRVKLESCEGDIKKEPTTDVEPTVSEEIDFKELKLEKVIDQSALTKYITFKGEYKGQTAVIRLEKTPFDEESARNSLNAPELEAKRNLINDVYSRYNIRPPSNGVADLKAIIVVPANETVLAKYSRNETILFYESPSVYQMIVEKFITETVEKNKDYNQWVYNILEGKTETEHVLYNDPDPKDGFMLLPSLKSSGDDKDIHYIALCHRRDIRSLRDLNASHLPLLDNIHQIGHEALNQKYDYLEEGQIRSYIHYHPTFYHFHVHFEQIDPAEYKSSDRDNLLTDVIENIRIRSDYYQRRMLAFPVSIKSALWKHIDAAGIVGSPYPRFLGPPGVRNMWNSIRYGEKRII
uniref:m7GpppX diphosphatase n=1 Tax=Aceria tosichella TaxID=561515 RepID=A0A6G1S865_9ACAR